MNREKLDSSFKTAECGSVIVDKKNGKHAEFASDEASDETVKCVYWCGSLSDGET